MKHEENIGEFHDRAYSLRTAETQADKNKIGENDKKTEFSVLATSS